MVARSRRRLPVADPRMEDGTPRLLGDIRVQRLGDEATAAEEPVRAAERARLAAVFRRVAAGRREYAGTAQMDHAARWLEHEADLFDVAALIVEGDLKPLYGLLPSWRWDDEMNARVALESTTGQSGDRRE